MQYSGYQREPHQSLGARDANQRGQRYLFCRTLKINHADPLTFVQMVDAAGVEERCAALDTVDHVAFVQQQLGELGAGLAGDAGDECNFWCGHLLLGVASLRFQ